MISLQDKIDQAGSAFSLLRNSSARADPGPRTGAEFTNWREEQASWRDSAALFDLSHHMDNLTVHGPDAIALFSHLGVNSVANLAVGKAKQLVTVNENGHVIGDGILDYMGPDDLRLAGTEAIVNWVRFHIETGDWDVTYSYIRPTATNPVGHPDIYRYQVNGPRALEILTKVNGGPIPDIKFFNAGFLTIGKHRVRALSHTMSRAPGLELTGPWSEAAAVVDALMEAGREFGLTRVGSRAPTPGALESGWLHSPLPAIYDTEEMKAYREWLPATSFEATASLSGSFVPAAISDYYLTPANLGYGRLVKFDHDFIGREALETSVDEPQRHKVTLAWNNDDVLRVLASGFGPGTPEKAIEFPLASYGVFQYDEVRVGDEPVGISAMAGYTYNERTMLSLAVVDADVKAGSEVTLVWGEPEAGQHRAQVEQHVQSEIRATVSRVPYSDVYNK